MKIQSSPECGQSCSVTSEKRIKPSTVGRLQSVALLALALATQVHANLLTNGSFEQDSVSTFDDSYSELPGTAKSAGSIGGYYTPSGWSRSSRIWLMEKGDETFPDGGYACKIDGNGNVGGKDVLAQGGLELQAGKTYRLTFAIWGGGLFSSTTEKLDVRLTRGYSDITDSASGTGVLILDDKTSVANDVMYETVTVQFTPAVTDSNYALQFFADSIVYQDDHICIDNLALSEVTNLIANGSFEQDGVSTFDDSYSELPGTAKSAGSIGGYYTPSGWSRSSRIWLMEKGDETFPDGSYACKIDGNGSAGGIDVLAQAGLPLVAGKTYRLTFAIWGGGQFSSVTEKLDVRLTRDYSSLTDPTSGTGVLVLDDKTTVASDGSFETVSVDITPGVTSSNYGLQFFADNPVDYRDDHICIDKIALSAMSVTYADWAIANGVAGGPDVDSDNDGVDNGVEYFMGITSSDPVFTANPALDSSNMITWPMSSTFNGSYEVETSTDLGIWTPVTPRPAPVEGDLTYTLPSGVPGGKNFIRLIVIPD